MQSKQIIRIFGIVLILCFFSTANAIDRIPAQIDSTIEIIDVDSLPEKFLPYVQIAFGFSQRIDEDSLINSFPMFQSKLYFHFSEKMAAKISIGYSSPNKFKSESYDKISYRNLKLETGFRWNLFNSIFNLYHENGIEYNYYYEPQSQIWEQRIGLNLYMGINFRMYKEYILDISIGQTFNNGNFSSTKNFEPAFSPIGLKNDKFFNEVFNPLIVQVLIFKNL